MSTSSATGVFQSDLILKHGIAEGLKILRSTPWLLDSVTRGIQMDPLTQNRYGKAEHDRLKKWFINTEIPVVIYRQGPPIAPSVSLALVSSNIQAETLADIHYNPEEVISAEGTELVVTVPFTPIYNKTTGLMILPDTLSSDIYPGMAVVDSVGGVHPILSVESSVAPISFYVATGLNTKFTNAYIRSNTAGDILETQESIKFKEMWSIGCHVHGEPGHMLYLHSLVSFVLLWGKETLLEKRGFELSDFSSTDFSKNQAFDEENVWSRFINLNGMTQSVWPKRRLARIAGVRGALRIIDGAHVPADFGDVNDLAWIGDQDSLGAVITQRKASVPQLINDTPDGFYFDVGITRPPTHDIPQVRTFSIQAIVNGGYPNIWIDSPASTNPTYANQVHQIEVNGPTGLQVQNPMPVSGRVVFQFDGSSLSIFYVGSWTVNVYNNGANLVASTTFEITA